MCSCFWTYFVKKKCAAASENYVQLSKYFEVKQVKIKTMSMYIWLKYENHFERISVAVKNIDHLFHLASEIMGADRFHLFFLPDGTRIDDNECLESLENGTELVVCTEEQIQKLLICFELKRYLSLKSISYPSNIDYFLWLFLSKWTGWLLF